MNDLMQVEATATMDSREIAERDSEDIKKYICNMINIVGKEKNTRSKRPGKVYIIKDRANGFYKIGSAINIKERIKSLTCGSAVGFDIFLTISDANYKKIERKMHKIFDRYRIRGEWFDLSNIGHKNIRKLACII